MVARRRLGLSRCSVRFRRCRRSEIAKTPALSYASYHYSPSDSQIVRRPGKTIFVRCVLAFRSGLQPQWLDILTATETASAETILDSLVSLRVPLRQTTAPALGGSFQTIYTFTGADSSSVLPSGGMTFAAGKLWGTAGGGASNYGTIYSINSDGSGFTTNYAFTGTDNSSINPRGGLTLAGGQLWGTAQGGGAGLRNHLQRQCRW